MAHAIQLAKKLQLTASSVLLDRQRIVDDPARIWRHDHGACHTAFS